MITDGATWTAIIHVLENYGIATTKTLCGIAVPEMLGVARGNLHCAHVGHETCGLPERSPGKGRPPRRIAASDAMVCPAVIEYNALHRKDHEPYVQ